MNKQDLLPFKGKTVDEVISIIEERNADKLQKEKLSEEHDKKIIIDFINQKYHKVIFHESASMYVEVIDSNLNVNSVTFSRNICNIEKRWINKLWLKNQGVKGITPITQEEYESILNQVTELITKYL